MNNNIIKLAINQAKQIISPTNRYGGFFRHSAILFHKKHIYNIGRNYKNKTSPHSPNEYKTIHAELDALLGVDRKNLIGSSMLVIRIGAKDNLTMSKPCIHCQHLIKNAGIKTLFYSNQNGQIIRERV